MDEGIHWGINEGTFLPRFNQSELEIIAALRDKTTRNSLAFSLAEFLCQQIFMANMLWYKKKIT